MADKVKYGNLPFTDAIKYFSDKGMMISPNSWRDFDRKAHAKGFTVARVTAQDVLTDIRDAVKQTVDSGQSLGDFKKDLRGTLTKKGWYAPKGEAAKILMPDGTIRKRLNGWRLDTIYNANLQSAYSAGRYKQQMESKSRPYWQYKAILDSRTRTTHAAMDGKVFKKDDPVWDTWYPPNGWHCRCYVKSLSARDMENRGLAVETATVGEMPEEGWNYNPGKAAWGSDIAKAEIDRAVKNTWIPLDEKGPGDFGRSALVPYVPMPAKIGKTIVDYERSGLNASDTKQAALSDFRKAIGGSFAQITDAAGEPVMLDDYLFNHLRLDGREAYFPLMKDVLQKPYEIWLSFEESKQTGKVVMRRRYVKFYQDDKKRHVMMVAESQRGSMVGYTFLRGDNPKYFNDFRKGYLLYGE